MKFNFHREFKEMSGVLREHFGYRLEYQTIPPDRWKRWKTYVLRIVKPETATTGPVLLCSTGWKCSVCFQQLYKHLSTYGIDERNGTHVVLPGFHSARELKMKMELRGMS